MRTIDVPDCFLQERVLGWIARMPLMKRPSAWLDGLRIELPWALRFQSFLANVEGRHPANARAPFSTRIGA